MTPYWNQSKCICWLALLMTRQKSVQSDHQPCSRLPDVFFFYPTKPFETKTYFILHLISHFVVLANTSVVSYCAHIELIISSPYVTTRVEHRAALSRSSRDRGPCPPQRTRTGILSRAATTQQVLPGKLCSRITRCINRLSGNEASRVRGTEEETRQT